MSINCFLQNILNLIIWIEFSILIVKVWFVEFYIISMSIMKIGKTCIQAVHKLLSIDNYLSGMKMEFPWAEPGTAHFFWRLGGSLSMLGFSAPLAKTTGDSFYSNEIKWFP